MSAAEHQQPSATRSTGDITSHDDDIKTVSGSGIVTRATSVAYPACGGGGARTKDDRRSPTSGARRGRCISKPVGVTQSAPEAATAMPLGLLDTHPLVGARHGDYHRPHSSDSDDHPNKQNRHQRKKKQSTSSWKRQCAGDSKHCTADTTSNSAVVVAEPLIITPPSDMAQSYGKAEADSAGNTDGTSESSIGIERRKEPRVYATTVTHSRRKCAGSKDPSHLNVESEGNQR